MIMNNIHRRKQPLGVCCYQNDYLMTPLFPREIYRETKEMFSGSFLKFLMFPFPVIYNMNYVNKRKGLNRVGC